MLYEAYHFTFSGDKKTHNFTEEAGQQRIEGCLRLQEAIDFSQKCLFTCQFVINLCDIWC